MAPDALAPLEGYASLGRLELGNPSLALLEGLEMVQARARALLFGLLCCFRGGGRGPGGGDAALAPVSFCFLAACSDSAAHMTV